MKCIHPRRANNLMVNFLSEISDLQFAYVKYGDTLCPVVNWEGVSDEEKAKLSFAKRKIQIHKGESFAACFDSFDTQYLKFTYNFEQLESFGTFLFWFNFCNLYPEAENFNPIIPILLHELGHFLSTQDFENYSRTEEMKKLKEADWIEGSFDYFNLPDEKSATDWAINWLSKKENQEMAKIFEKNFLKCCE